MTESGSIFVGMNHSIHRLFVYGTLRSDVKHKAHEFIERYFSLIGKAKVRGKLYDCIEFPAGMPDEGEHFITGELYEIKDAAEFSEALRVLDEYEGSYDDPNEPTLFRRAQVNVFFNDGNVQALIYWYNRPVTGLKWISSGDILKSDS